MSLKVSNTIRKHTGIFVENSKGKLYELSEYNIFVKYMCHNLRNNKTKIPGSGNTMKYIASCWKLRKSNDLIMISEDLEYDNYMNMDMIVSHTLGIKG